MVAKGFPTTVNQYKRQQVVNTGGQMATTGFKG